MVVPGTPRCCWVNQETDEWCMETASYRIFADPRPDPYDYTESCTEHLADMLTDAPEHRLIRLRQQETTTEVPA